MLQLGERSLTASKADARLFANRIAELAAAERALDLGFNVYVSGPSGSGRTSFLQQLKARQQGAIFLNLARVGDFASLIYRLSATIDPRLDTVAYQAQKIADDPKRMLLGIRGPDRLSDLRDALATQSSPPTMLLDNLDETLRHELFGRQRDELWQFALQWVVVGDTPVLDPPANSFFESSIALEPFDSDSIRELLLRRGQGSTPQQQELVREIADTLPDLLGPATPRRVMSTARAILLSPDPESDLKQLRDPRYSHHELSATARLVLDGLYAVGPAHAGNEQLLKQVGATRSRVVQILKNLEEAGLVHSVRVGKRKLYAPTLGGSGLPEQDARDDLRASRTKAEAEARH